MNIGRVIQVVGVVVDVEFPPGQVPDIYNALKIRSEDQDRDYGEWDLTLEAALHLGNNRVRCIAMSSTDALVRGMKVVDTGKPIAVPVGRPILGRMLDVLGNPIDGGGEAKSDTYYPIHRPAPEMADLSNTGRNFRNWD